MCVVQFTVDYDITWIKMLRGPGPWEEEGPFHTNISRLSISATLDNAQPRTTCRSVFKQSEILPVPCQYILSLINFITVIRKLFKQVHLYTILIQEISIIFIDQMPTFLVLKKEHSMLT